MKEIETRYQAATYAKLPISIEKGSGCYVYDDQGKTYLDFYGGHCVASTGHCHPRVVQAIQAQAEKLLFYSNATYNSTRARAAEKIIGLTGKTYHQVFLVNCGAEANENAIKLARAATGRKEVISSFNAFHGRTYGALSATGVGNYRDYLNTPVPNHTIIEIEDIPGAVSENTAAVLIEPIQSMGGIRVIPVELLEQISQVCLKHGALLIFDEIQTGIGRTGSFLYSQQLSFIPDLTTIAKGVASGIPAGGVLISEKIAGSIRLGDLGSTFGGGPIPSAAILATLEVLEDEDLFANALEVGEYICKGINSIAIGNPDSPVKSISGKGLLLGIRFEGKTAREIQSHLMKDSILAGTSFDPQVLRLMPPLTLTKLEADKLLDSLKKL
ncbi:MAG: aminotransferase class III-fold pyridoxal phosphate-dependent enzyme [Anaerolineales bacterium]|nr:aminotransferase class III-fold pyridoxal phosphate-dependent enzyme [Anaerolineales bacterium]